MVNLIDVEHPSWMNPSTILVSRKQNIAKNKQDKTLLGPNYRNSSLAAQLRLFCMCFQDRLADCMCSAQQPRTLNIH